jgi:hypothetical protein
METYNLIIENVKNANAELVAQLKSESALKRAYAKRDLQPLIVSEIEKHLKNDDDFFMVPNINDGGKTEAKSYSFLNANIANFIINTLGK